MERVSIDALSFDPEGGAQEIGAREIGARDIRAQEGCGARREAARYHMVIDVRSPSEFAEDHAPGAVNLAVLDDAERAEVGTVYVQDCAFRARKIGAAMAARNIARHLDERLSEMPGGWRPLVMCWRGGQRSRSMAAVLSEIGWRVGVLEGGYQAYRRSVSAALYGAEPWFRLIAIEGPTGSGKTALLAKLAERGRAVVDLEAIARHRGSVFGLEPGDAQPSQKAFESGLLLALRRATAHAAGEPILVEAESSKIGARILPPTFWKALRAAPRIRLDAPVVARARHVIGTYAALAADRARFDTLLGKLTPHCGRERVAAWRAMAAAGENERMVTELMTEHYDPAYRRSSGGAAPAARVALTAVDGPALDRAAAEVEAAAAEIARTGGGGKERAA